MALDLTGLVKAVHSYERAVAVASSKEKMAALEPDQRDAIRAGVIQNFEFTYELCWKFIQRWLKDDQMQPESDLPRTRKELFRMAAQRGLVQDPIAWSEFGDARNLTSHTYDESKAQIVFEAAVRFVGEARDLLRRLEAGND